MSINTAFQTFIVALQTNKHNTHWGNYNDITAIVCDCTMATTDCNLRLMGLLVWGDGQKMGRVWRKAQTPASSYKGTRVCVHVCVCSGVDTQWCIYCVSMYVMWVYESMCVCIVFYIHTLWWFVHIATCINMYVCMYVCMGWIGDTICYLYIAQ